MSSTFCDVIERRACETFKKNYRQRYVIHVSRHVGGLHGDVSWQLFLESPWGGVGWVNYLGESNEIITQRQIPENRFSQFINLERTTHNTTNDCYTPRPMAKQIPTGTRPVGGEQFHNLLANILNSTRNTLIARHIGPTMLHNGNDSNEDNKYIRDTM